MARRRGRARADDTTKRGATMPVTALALGLAGLLMLFLAIAVGAYVEAASKIAPTVAKDIAAID
jgi:hypothetical protein